MEKLGWPTHNLPAPARRQEADDALAPGLCRQVEEWIGYPFPTEQEEEANLSWVDTKYEEAVTSLREATWDTSRFPLVFAENANYGFRRNLWGLKPIGALIAAVLVMVSWTLLLLTI